MAGDGRGNITGSKGWNSLKQRWLWHPRGFTTAAGSGVRRQTWEISRIYCVAGTRIKYPAGPLLFSDCCTEQNQWVRERIAARLPGMQQVLTAPIDTVDPQSRTEDSLEDRQHTKR